MNVAVVYNQDFTGVLKKRKTQTREVYKREVIERIAKAIGDRGHRVEIMDGNMHFFERIREFALENGVEDTFVFNLAYGIQGESRYSHIPGMLELLGIPYTGSGPLGHSLALDKVATKVMFSHSGIPTPDFHIVSKPSDMPGGLEFPLVVKPRMEAVSLGVTLVENEEELKANVERLLEEFSQDVLIEEFIEGREFSVSLIGNGEDLKAFPVSEIDLSELPHGIQTHSDKMERPPRKICPAEIPEEVATKMVELSKKAFDLLCLRDYARFDIRMNGRGEIFFLEVNSMASLNPSGSYVCSTRAAGLTYEELINEILEVAVRRYERDA